MPNLFTPLKIRSLELKNRIVVSPMCQYSSTDGFANDWHLVHLGSRAVGGASLVFTEATAVTPEGRISPEDLGLWKDEHIPFLKRITDFIKNQNAVPGIQLAHAGRKASHLSPWKGGKALGPKEGAWQCFAPSEIAFSENEPGPKAMSPKEIENLILDFGRASLRALKAGFTLLEIHAAHGYLINEFLSPLSNKRTDRYGGSFENRIRLLIEIVTAIREVWPKDLPLFVRLSATEWTDGGWNEGDSVCLAEQLRTKGVDLMDCSSGGNVPNVKIPLVPLYQVPLAESIKQKTAMLTGAVGLITTAKEANSIIAENRADLVFLAREMLRDPYFPLRAAFELNTDSTWAKQYERAKKKIS